MKSRKDPETGLTELQQRFVENYMKSPDRNASNALRDAGYNGQGYARYAIKLLNMPAVQQAIARIAREDLRRKRNSRGIKKGA